MPDIPTLKDTVVHALHSARLQAAEWSGNPGTVIAVPVVGVCVIINEDGPLLQVDDIELVQATLDELVAEDEYERKVPMRGGFGYVILPDAPPGMSPSTDGPPHSRQRETCLRTRSSGPHHHRR